MERLAWSVLNGGQALAPSLLPGLVLGRSTDTQSSILSPLSSPRMSPVRLNTQCAPPLVQVLNPVRCCVVRGSESRHTLPRKPESLARGSLTESAQPRGVQQLQLINECAATLWDSKCISLQWLVLGELMSQPGCVSITELSDKDCGICV